MGIKGGVSGVWGVLVLGGSIDMALAVGCCCCWAGGRAESK